ncbi:MAG TPA: hypothetical protein VHY79_13465 [Rhizomicrobium sp.]|jgi:hypothetical protein|nr:hypothetical protein [Rhizomicrobium sp.]
MRRFIPIGILIVLGSGMTFADASPVGAPHAAMDPCKGQYEKFCSSVAPGAGRKLICMMQHSSQLTPACRTRTKGFYGLESQLAARKHMTLPQFMAWGQSLMQNAEEHHTDYKIEHGSAKPAPAAAAHDKSAPPPSKRN